MTERNEQKKLKLVAMELPMARYSKGKSSPTNSDEIGEIPEEGKHLIKISINTISLKPKPT